MTEPSKLRRRLKGALVVLASLCIGVVLIELVLRLTAFRDLLNETRYPDGYFVADAQLGADHAPNVPRAPFTFRGPGFDVYTNSLGCFDDDAPPQDGYVLAVGDSMTWGFVPQEDGWTTRLEPLIGRQVLNCGVSGTGTRHALATARRILAATGKRPGAILLMYSDNDLNDDVLFPAHRVIDGQRVNRLKEMDLLTGDIVNYPDDELATVARSAFGARGVIRRHSILAHLVQRSWEAVRGTPEPPATLRFGYQVLFWDLDPAGRPWLPKALEAHLQTLRDLRRVADEAGTELVFLDTVDRAHLRGPLRDAFAAAVCRDVRHVHALYGEVEEGADEPLHHPFDPHWNAAGNRRVAESVAAFLERSGALKP